MKKVATLVAVFMVSALPAFAHHGWGGNEDKLSDVTGTVTTGVSLAGPHATMKIKDAQGHIWDVTMAPPNRTQQSGVTEKLIPVGATVMVHGHRNKSPEHLRDQGHQADLQRQALRRLSGDGLDRNSRLPNSRLQGRCRCETVSLGPGSRVRREKRTSALDRRHRARAPNARVRSLDLRGRQHRAHPRRFLPLRFASRARSPAARCLAPCAPLGSRVSRFAGRHDRVRDRGDDGRGHARDEGDRLPGQSVPADQVPGDRGRGSSTSAR